MPTIDIVTYVRLLRRLVHELGFRARFEANPIVELQQMGINISFLPGPLQGTLPSQADLERMLRLLEKGVGTLFNGPSGGGEGRTRLTGR